MLAARSVVATAAAKAVLDWEVVALAVLAAWAVSEAAVVARVASSVAAMGAMRVAVVASSPVRRRHDCNHNALH